MNFYSIAAQKYGQGSLDFFVYFCTMIKLPIAFVFLLRRYIKPILSECWKGDDVLVITPPPPADFIVDFGPKYKVQYLL